MESAIKNYHLIEEEEVECRPDRVPDAVVDENVDVCLVRRHFSSDTWLLVEDVVKQKSEKMTWTCHACFHDLPKNIPTYIPK